MSCCACECEDGKDSDNITREVNPTQALQFVQAGKSIQHPLKAAVRSINADAFAADLQVSFRFSHWGRVIASKAVQLPPNPWKRCFRPLIFPMIM